jgi:hypothetical protein
VLRYRATNQLYALRDHVAAVRRQIESDRAA